MERTCHMTFPRRAERSWGNTEHWSRSRAHWSRSSGGFKQVLIILHSDGAGVKDLGFESFLVTLYPVDFQMMLVNLSVLLHTPQRGRWSEDVRSGTWCSLLWEFCQTIGWWEPADAPHRSPPDRCTCTDRRPPVHRHWSLDWRRSEVNSPMYGVSILKECSWPWGGTSDGED